MTKHTDTRRPDLIEAEREAAEALAVFLAAGGKIQQVPIAPATNHNPQALSFNESGKPKRNRSFDK